MQIKHSQQVGDLVYRKYSRLRSKSVLPESNTAKMLQLNPASSACEELPIMRTICWKLKKESRRRGLK